MKGIPIGELLIQQGVLTRKQVDHLLNVQKACHRPIGDLAERLYGVSPKAVEDAWVQQYLQIIGITDLDEIRVDEECLRLINRRQAWQFHLLPANRENGELNVATDARNLIRAVNFSARRIDEPVLFRIAHRQQLREFLQQHFPVPGFMREYADDLT